VNTNTPFKSTYTLQLTQTLDFTIGSYYTLFSDNGVKQKIENPLSALLLALTLPAPKSVFHGAIKNQKINSEMCK